MYLASHQPGIISEALPEQLYNDAMEPIEKSKTFTTHEMQMITVLEHLGKDWKEIAQIFDCGIETIRSTWLAWEPSDISIEKTMQSTSKEGSNKKREFTVYEQRVILVLKQLGVPKRCISKALKCSTTPLRSFLREQSKHQNGGTIRNDALAEIETGNNESPDTFLARWSSEKNDIPSEIYGMSRYQLMC